MNQAKPEKKSVETSNGHTLEQAEVILARIQSHSGVQGKIQPAFKLIPQTINIKILTLNIINNI